MTYRIILILCLTGCLNFNSFAQSDKSTCYVFGHSLIDHRPPINPTPSDETTVPHWLQLLANHANKEFSLSGKYGFLPQHASQPIFSQWGYDIVNSAWESDYEPFSDADFSTIMITAGNFIQFQAHTEEYYGDPGVTPLSATLQVIDNVVNQEDSMKVIIYENWPDMGSIAPDFPPNANQLETYYNYTENEFHDWWIDYHDDLDASRPDLNIKMVPVGPVFADIFVNTILKDIPVTELYEDNAPHGRASLYFLASLISYMAIYEEKPPLDYDVPAIVHSLIAENYNDIVERMWKACVDFNFEDGRNRVFTQNDVLSNNVVADKQINVYPNPVTDHLYIESDFNKGKVEIYNLNQELMGTFSLQQEVIIDMNSYYNGIYFIKIIESSENIFYRKVIKN